MSITDPTVLRAAGFAAAGSLFWLQYWDLKDRKRPEPRGHLVAAFALGCASALLAFGLYAAVAALGVRTQPGGDPAQTLFVCLAVVGPVEEVAKFALARMFVFRWRAFDERVDGIVYAAAIALGFAAVENLIWLPGMATRDAFVRALISPLVHTLFAAIWGLGTARAFLDARSRLGRFAWQAGSLALAALVHGAYDAILELGASSIVVALWVLVHWTAVILAARHAVLRDDAAIAARAER